MSDQRPPFVLVFDVNETLLDLTTLAPVFGRVFGAEATMREWFAQLVLYSQSLTISGLYVPFGELATGTLRMMADAAGVGLDEDAIEDLTRRIGAMPALPDVAPALSALADAGFRLVTLTNSPPSASPSPLEKAGLADHFERSFSVDAVGRFKPAPETYRMVADDLGVEMSDLCLVACHLWDTLGAQAAGCSAALVKRPGNTVMPVDGVPMPDIVAEDMGDLTAKIIAKWESGGKSR